MVCKPMFTSTKVYTGIKWYLWHMGRELRRMPCHIDASSKSVDLGNHYCPHRTVAKANRATGSSGDSCCELEVHQALLLPTAQHLDRLHRISPILGGKKRTDQHWKCHSSI